MEPSLANKKSAGGSKEGLLLFTRVVYSMILVITSVTYSYSNHPLSCYNHNTSEYCTLPFFCCHENRLLSAPWTKRLCKTFCSLEEAKEWLVKAEEAKEWLVRAAKEVEAVKETKEATA